MPPRSQDWLFTINNPTEDDQSTLLRLSRSTEATFCTYQTEEGAAGTRHIQGYIEFATRKTLSAAKRLLGGRAHLEPRRGTPEQAKQYCEKEDTRVEGPHNTWGTLSNRRAGITRDKVRNTYKAEELTDIYERLSRGEDKTSILSRYGELFLRHHKALDNLLTHSALRRDWKTRVTVLYGPTGTGKSKWCAENSTNGYWKPRGQWWDGYRDHESCIMDDFYGWIPFDQLLRLCDRYPLLVEVKGGVANFVAKHIMISSNKKPTNWYKSEIDISPFIRRVEQWIYIPEQNDIRIFQSFDAFINSITEKEINFVSA